MPYQGMVTRACRSIKCENNANFRGSSSSPGSNVLSRLWRFRQFRYINCYRITIYGKQAALYVGILQWLLRRMPTYHGSRSPKMLYPDVRAVFVADRTSSLKVSTSSSRDLLSTRDHSLNQPAEGLSLLHARHSWGASNKSKTWEKACPWRMPPHFCRPFASIAGSDMHA
jgi:hypothetical protein